MTSYATYPTESLTAPPKNKVGTFNPNAPINTPPVGTTPMTGGLTPKTAGPKGGFGSTITPTGMATPASFGPGSNLIGSQINPTPSARGVTTQNYTQGAQADYAGLPWYTPGQMPGVQSVGGYDQGKTQSLLDLAGRSLPGGGMAGGGGSAPGFSYSGQTGTARDITMDQLQKMTGATPDRGKLAADTYQLLLERSQPGYDQGVRALGQNAARLGRIGSGLTTNELTDFATQRERGLDQSRRELATGAAGMTLQDAIDRLGAARSTSDSFAGQDTAAGGLNLSAYNSGRAADAQRFGSILDLAGFQRQLGSDTEGSAVRERDTGLGNDWRRYDTGTDLQDRNVDLARNRFGDFRGYEGQVSDEDFRGRQETRGERDYQYGLSRDAQGDAERRQAAEQDWQDNMFDRGVTLDQLGRQESPAGAYGDRAKQYQQQSQDAFDAWAPALEAYGGRRRPTTTTRAPTYGAPVDPNDWQNVV
jgi:hypothetical protein